MAILDLREMSEKELAAMNGALVFINFGERGADFPDDFQDGLFEIVGLDAAEQPSFFILKSQLGNATQSLVEFDEISRIAVIVYPEKKPPD